MKSISRISAFRSGLLAGSVPSRTARASAITAAALCLSAAVAFAQPTTRPSHDRLPGLFGPGDQPAGQRGENGPGGPGRFPRMFDMAQPSQEEIDEAVTFFKDHSPKKMELYDQLPPESFLRRRVSGVLVRMYRPIKRFRDDDMEMYNLAVEQVELRDQAFELAREGKTSDLHAKVAQLVELSLEARQNRLDRLEKSLADEKAALQRDRSRQDALVDEQAAKITSNAQELVHGLEDRGGRRPRGYFRGTTMPTTAPSPETLAPESIPDPAAAVAAAAAMEDPVDFLLAAFQTF